MLIGLHKRTILSGFLAAGMLRCAGLPWEESQGGASRVVLVDTLAGGVFTRNSTFSRFTNEAGSRIEQMGVNAPRIEPIDGVGDMSYQEKQLANGLLFTEQADNGNWTGLNATRTANAAASPDMTGGTQLVTADRLAATAGGSECHIRQTPGGSTGRPQFTVWLKYDSAGSSPSTTASIEIDDGVAPINRDITLDPGDDWIRFRADPIVLAGSMTVRIRPHHKGVNPAAGQSILVFGANTYLPTTTRGDFTRNYIRDTNPVTSGANQIERREFAIGSYDPRALTGPIEFYWKPGFSWPANPGAAGSYGEDCTFLSIESSANEILWANNDGAIRVRCGTGPSTTYVDTTPMTWAYGALWLVRYHPGISGVPNSSYVEAILVSGTGTGGTRSLLGAFRTWASQAAGTLRIRSQGRYNDDAHACDGHMSKVWLSE